MVEEKKRKFRNGVLIFYCEANSQFSLLPGDNFLLLLHFLPDTQMFLCLLLLCVRRSEHPEVPQVTINQLVGSQLRSTQILYQKKSQHGDSLVHEPTAAFTLVHICRCQPSPLLPGIITKARSSKRLLCYNESDLTSFLVLYPQNNSTYV